ncbi:hypothetical protein WJX72_002752 [[Myrmecia] bisecta]|uniref:Uncharacterized protein n=1 Tax=[Myrmecia] bisecta TaxID=41462 RepID=A0AAW1R5H9_9CHLO
MASVLPTTLKILVNSDTYLTFSAGVRCPCAKMASRPLMRDPEPLAVHFVHGVASAIRYAEFEILVGCMFLIVVYVFINLGASDVFSRVFTSDPKLD